MASTQTSSSAETRRVVQQHNERWARGDLAGVLALYRAGTRFTDHYAGMTYQGDALARHVRSVLARSSLDSLSYTDRMRVDGDTAVLRYTETMRSAYGDELLRFSACDVVRVQGGSILSIDEYAMPIVSPAARSGGRQRAADKMGLGPRALGQLLDDLDQYLRTHRPYLNPALNLQEVSRATGYTRNQISFALNHGMGTSFYAFINQARVNHVLAHPSEPGTPMALVAQAAGFRSLSTFYAAFKRHAGALPGAVLPAIQIPAKKSKPSGRP